MDKRRKAIPPRPDAPEEVKCAFCKEATWVVPGPNGDAGVVIDVWPLETQVDIAGDLIRAEFRHPLAATHGGWRLHDPEYHYGWAMEPEPEPEETVEGGAEKAAKPVEPLKFDPGWTWYASPMSLVEAERSGAIIYSEHIYTCAAVSVQAVIAKATNIAVEGDAAGDREAKRRGANVKHRLQDGFAPGLSALQEGSAQTPATAQGQPEAAQTQLLMF